MFLSWWRIGLAIEPGYRFICLLIEEFNILCLFQQTLVYIILKQIILKVFWIEYPPPNFFLSIDRITVVTDFVYMKMITLFCLKGDCQVLGELQTMA